MTKLMLRQTIALVALLASSAGMAAQVTITSNAYLDIASNTYLVPVGQTFQMTIRSDVLDSYATTMALAFDPTKVVYTSGTFLAPWNFYSKVSANNATPTDFYVEAPTAQTITPYNVAVLTFTALAVGSAGIVINDENCASGANGWADTQGGCIPNIVYNNANVRVTPIPAAVWLFGSGLGLMSMMPRKIVT